MDSALIALASRQHGVVARRQLLRLGLSPGQIHGHARRGALVLVRRGVYMVAGAPVTVLSEVMAAVLRAGDGARTAGERLLAAQGVRDAAVDGPFVVLVPPGRRLTDGTITWREDRHPSCGLTATVQGLPSFHVERNLLEAALDTGDDRRVQRLADGVRRRGSAHARRLHELAMRHLDHGGARRLLLLGCLDADAAESDPERYLEALLADLSPQRQVVLLEGVRVDLYIAALRVVVEYDGEADHTSSAARHADRGRDALLEALGYRVVRITKDELHDPESIRRRVLGDAG